MSKKDATQLQIDTWKALSLIPKGRVTSYGAVAKYMKTNAIRVVASAVGKNPNAPGVPCHRVVLADGKIGNYSGGDGVKTKIEYLSKEGVTVEKGKISNYVNLFWDFEL